MKNFKYVCILLMSLLIFNCSSSDDGNPSTPQSSVIKGTWSDSVKVNNESLKTTLTLDETNGILSGSGKILFENKTEQSTKKIEFDMPASGTLQSKDVVVTVSSASDKFTFAGKLSNDNSTMSGAVILVLKNNFVFSDSTYNFNVNLKKK